MQFEKLLLDVTGWRNIIIAAMLLFSGCERKLPAEGKVVFTQIPVTSVSVVQLSDIDGKYAPGMKIGIAALEEGLKNMHILTEQFFSARSPEVSYDGKQLVFSGQLTEGDVWQIWILNIGSGDIEQVTDSRTNCTDPSWLPSGDIVFSKLITEENSLKYHALFTIGSDGCCEQRITFQPHNDINSSILHDGRILVDSRQVYPEQGALKYLALRPDGTKAELFHKAGVGSKITGKAMEDNNGSVLFCEDKTLTSVSFNRPLHSKTTLGAWAEHETHSLFVKTNGDILLSLKKEGEPLFGISLLDNSNSLTELFHVSSSGHHLIEPQIVQERKVPKKLPTRVNPEMNYGYFIAMDTDASDIEAEGKTAKVQVFGISDLIGQADVEEDGSFYLELPSDRPIRFQTLDENGEVLRGPSSWMWLRPNERRACAGCHQDREITPENIVPVAVKKGPLAMIR